MIYFGYFFFSDYPFGVEKTNKFMRSRGSLENHTRFKTSWSKSISVFRPKRLKKRHTLWGGTYPYSVYRGVTPPPGTEPVEELWTLVVYLVIKVAFNQSSLSIELNPSTNLSIIKRMRSKAYHSATRCENQ